MSARDCSSTSFGGGRDQDAGTRSLAERLRRHANTLERGRRSALYVTLMRGAAADLQRGGVVAELFDGMPAAPGSVPALRLMAALHRLVLAGGVPELAAHYPSAGGSRPPDDAWPLAAAALRDNFEAIRARLTLTVQTNEPGRAAVLYGGLLWLHERHGLPIRLLEVGASGGLNLLADRFAYRVGGETLGEGDSPLTFVDPWIGSPVPAPALSARTMRVTERSGCDIAPLDLASPEDRLTLRSYLWPDEPDRLARIDAALAVAADDPPQVVACAAERWLAQNLAAPRSGELTVIWQSVVRQYVSAESWTTIEHAVQAAGRAATASSPLAWLTMEPGEDPLAGFLVSATTWPGAATRQLAGAGDHGLPVRWLTDPFG